MILAQLDELTIIDNTIQNMHQKLRELYERRQQITLPSQDSTHARLDHELLQDIDMTIDLDSINLDLDQK